MEVMLYDMQRGSMVDGPGIRTTVFMKGCPLRCRWCHNPESILPLPEKAWLKGGDSKNEDTILIGWREDVTKILELLVKDKPFFTQSGGGVTLSGGEPMMQSEAVKEIFLQCREQGIHTCLDTSGHCNTQDLKDVLVYTDMILWDVKAQPGTQHTNLTGVDGSLIYQNFDHALAAEIPIILRCPLIPGLNDRREDIQWISSLSHLPQVKQVDVLPYHSIGLGKKYKTHLGHEQEQYTLPTREHIDRWKELFSIHGLVDKVHF